MMLAHGLVSSALFALVDYSYGITGTRRLFLTKGLLRVSPVAMGLFWFRALACNMGVPPSMNLLGELSLLMGAGRVSWGFLVLGRRICFLGAAYSLHLYVGTAHGWVTGRLRPPGRAEERFYLVIVLHLLPVFLAVLRRERWVWGGSLKTSGC